MTDTQTDVYLNPAVMPEAPPRPRQIKTSELLANYQAKTDADLYAIRQSLAETQSLIRQLAMKPSAPQNIPQSTGSDAAQLLLAFSQMQTNSMNQTLLMLRALKEIMPEVSDGGEDMSILRPFAEAVLKGMGGNAANQPQAPPMPLINTEPAPPMPPQPEQKTEDKHPEAV